jgi:hypothetical protein
MKLYECPECCDLVSERPTVREYWVWNSGFGNWVNEAKVMCQRCYDRKRRMSTYEWPHYTITYTSTGDTDSGQ